MVKINGGSRKHNVKAYGALDDGDRDDTAAIQAAIDAAAENGYVYFPNGTYILYSNKHLRKNGR